MDSESANSCTAQCSVVNAKSGSGTCQAASFTPYTHGRNRGSSVLSGSDPSYASKDGAVAIVPTGISSNADNYAAFGPASYSNTSIDTSALAASIHLPASHYRRLISLLQPVEAELSRRTFLRKPRMQADIFIGVGDKSPHRQVYGWRSTVRLGLVHEP